MHNHFWTTSHQLLARKLEATGCVQACVESSFQPCKHLHVARLLFARQFLRSLESRYGRDKGSLTGEVEGLMPFLPKRCLVIATEGLDGHQTLKLEQVKTARIKGRIQAPDQVWHNLGAVD